MTIDPFVSRHLACQSRKSTLTMALLISACGPHWRRNLKVHCKYYLYLSPQQVYVRYFQWQKSESLIPLNKPTSASAKVIQLTSIFSTQHNNLSFCLWCCLVPAERICLEGTQVQMILHFNGCLNSVNILEGWCCALVWWRVQSLFLRFLLHNCQYTSYTTELEI